MRRCLIIRNSKLVEDVPHVLVNDPTREYEIFIENIPRTIL
ncbi:MAG: SpoIVB peptidase S55 domain-containing protein [Ruminococcus sp.]|nr:SpoIVB peptidase S55 domain-containing protein [Ruminococcus sp.]